MKKIGFCLGLVVTLMVCSPLCRGDDSPDQASTNPKKYGSSDDPSGDPSFPPGIGIISPIPPETVEAEKLLYDIYNEIGKINEKGEELGVGPIYPNGPKRPIY